MKFRNKRGELTTTQLVTIIVLIVSFVIILFLIFKLNLGQTTNQEICRNSVVLKDRLPLSGPLDCKTNYLCISGGSDCQEISATETVKVESNSKEEIMKALAEEMASCWLQFGEDKKLHYAGGTGDIVGTKVYCAICNIIEFDEKIQEKMQQISSYEEFYDFLEKTPKDNSQSYLQYLYGVSYSEDVSDLVVQNPFKHVVSDTNLISTREKYSIITGIDSNANNNNIDEGTLDNEWLKVYIIPTIDTAQTTCTDFITTA